MASKRKPWLTPTQQIAHLESKGVSFDIMNKQDAENYLTNNTNYFRLRSYRSNFAKVSGGPNDGKYIGLDFGMLVDLSIIDMRLRNEMLPITLDIEHFAKLRLMNKAEEHQEDGYDIVKDFLHQQESIGTHVYQEIDQAKSSPYTCGLVSSRPDYAFPVWELIEIITFGRFVHLYKFCADRFDDRHMRSDFYILQGVKGLRNGCAHNNCIINDMKVGSSPHKPQARVKSALGQIGVGVDMQRTKLSNERMQQVAAALYMHRELASSDVHESRAKSLTQLCSRMKKHSNYYKECTPISTGFDFFTRMIEGWYSLS